MPMLNNKMRFQCHLFVGRMPEPVRQTKLLKDGEQAFFGELPCATLFSQMMLVFGERGRRGRGCGERRGSDVSQLL